MSNKKKKAELTSKQLITIIILIVSFIILIIFYFALNIKGEITRETCKQSLALRGTSFISKYVLSVKCETEYFCMNMGGECVDAREEAKDIEIEDIDKLDDEIFSLAEECWDMVGRGKINFGSKKECGVCSVIYFDEEIQKEDLSVKFEDKEFSRDVSYSLSTDKPIAIIAIRENWDTKYSSVLLSQYASDALRETNCEKYLF